MSLTYCLILREPLRIACVAFARRIASDLILVHLILSTSSIAHQTQHALIPSPCSAAMAVAAKRKSVMEVSLVEDALAFIANVSS